MGFGVRIAGKMRRGVPLTDADRMPWLETLRDMLREYVVRGQCVVLACSALRPQYRDVLRTADDERGREAGAAEAGSKGSEAEAEAEDGREARPQAREGRSVAAQVVFVYLKCAAEVLAPRVIAREVGGHHYMPASLLQSQMEALQVHRSERDIVECDASVAPALIVQSIRSQLAL